VSPCGTPRSATAVSPSPSAARNPTSAGKFGANAVAAQITLQMFSPAMTARLRRIRSTNAPANGEHNPYTHANAAPSIPCWCGERCSSSRMSGSVPDNACRSA